MPKISSYDPDTVLDDLDALIGVDKVTGLTKRYTGSIIRAGMAKTTDLPAAADARIVAARGVAGGIAGLDGTGKVPSSQLPSTFGVGDTVLGAAQDNTGAKTYYRGTLLDKGSAIYDVKAFGAKGDGTADDYPAVAAAIAAIEAVRLLLSTSATLLFPDGEYLMSASIVIPSKMHVRGSGRGATTLVKNFTGTSSVLLDISGTGTSLDGSTHIREVSVRDIKLEGNGTTGTVLRCYYASEIYFQNVLFVGGNGRGLDAVEFYDSYFNQCAWEDFISTTLPVIHMRSSAAASGFGNSIDNTNMIWFSQCRIESLKYTAIKIESGTSGVSSSNGFFIDQMKIECSNVRADIISIDSSVLNVHIDKLYVYAGAFDSGYATPIALINIAARAGVSLENIHMSSAPGIVQYGIVLASTDDPTTLNNIMYVGTPTGSVINNSGAGPRWFGAVGTTGAAPLFSGNAPISGSQTAATFTNSDTTNNPIALQVLNAGSGADIEAKNTANDVNLNARTTGVSKAAFINLYATADAYNSISGWVSDVLKWRVGRSGDNNGVQILTLDGNTKAAQFKDDQTTQFFGKLGYGAGVGGTITQATSKATGVTLNKPSGTITMNGAALAAGTIVSFTLTNSTIEANDVLIINHASGGTIGSYSFTASAAAGSATIYVRNNTGGSLSEAIVLRFAVIRAVVA